MASDKRISLSLALRRSNRVRGCGGGAQAEAYMHNPSRANQHTPSTAGLWDAGTVATHCKRHRAPVAPHLCGPMIAFNKLPTADQQVSGTRQF